MVKVIKEEEEESFEKEYDKSEHKCDFDNEEFLF